jgi:hypothetical protein
VPSLGVARTHWPVVAWIRLKLPERPAPMVLMGSAPPPPRPPLDILVRNPVTTDPRKHIYHLEEEREDGAWVLRIVWDQDEPGILEAEYRAPVYNRRLARADVPKFWSAVKEKVGVLGPLAVESADPHP